MRVAVLSDIHGNLEALESVLRDIDTRGVDDVISLGDNVGYGPDPEAVVQRLDALGIHSTMGNHELGLSDPVHRGWFNFLSREALEKTEKLLSPRTLSGLGELPLFITRHGARFVHGMIPESPLDYLYQYDDDELVELLTKAPEPVNFIGHTHELERVELRGGAIIRKDIAQGGIRLDPESRHLLNIGSVGQPRDGDNRAKYALWSPGRHAIQSIWVDYDRRATMQKMREVGMPEQYIKRLL